MAQAWYQLLFHDHPLLASKDPSAYSRPETKERPKVFCRLCWNASMAAMAAEDNRAIQEGRHQAPWSTAEITDICKLYLFFYSNKYFNKII